MKLHGNLIVIIIVVKIQPSNDSEHFIWMNKSGIITNVTIVLLEQKNISNISFNF